MVPTLAIRLANAAWAANIDVPLDEPTVQDAVDAANPGDVIRIRAGTYTETVTVDQDLTFEGFGPGTVVLEADHPDDGFFKINAAGIVVTVRDLVLDGRGANRVVLHQHGELVLERVTIRDTRNTGNHGGAIHIESDTANAVTITDTVFEGASVGGSGHYGGAIAVIGGSLTVRNTTFTGGTSDEHGGWLYFASPGDLLLEDVTFTTGVAGKRGGALYLTSGEVVIRRALFDRNVSQTDRGGGAIYAENTSSLLVEDATFVENEAQGTEGGGALYHRNTGVTLLRTVFCANDSADQGGAIRQHSGTARVENAVFLDNEATTTGGAVWVEGGTFDLVHGSLAINSAGTDGHAVAGESGTAVNVVDTYVADHDAGTEALHTVAGGLLTTSTSLFWNNAGGDWSSLVVVGAGVITGQDPGIATPPDDLCDPLLLVPPAGSPLLGAASNGDDIGAFDGPNTWPDADGDGWISLADCDDAAATVHPGAFEDLADGIDQDCDGGDTCYADDDLDGFGTAGTAVASADLDCLDPGEAAAGDDVCEGHDDAIDADGDLQPDGCDPCPVDAPDDADFDGVCTSVDACPGEDDRLDSDGDGTPNGCDVCASPYDADGDGVSDDCDVCPKGDDAIDVDGDGLADACDPCPGDPADTDLDGVCDSLDQCPGADDRDDRDADGQPDLCDPCPLDPLDDSDADGVCDGEDRCPGADDAADADGDGVPDGCDPDVPPDETGDTGAPADTGDTGGEGPGDPPSGDRTPVAAAPDAPAGCGCGAGAPPAPALALALALALRRRR